MKPTPPINQPWLLALAGSNGAGKSTFTKLFLHPTGVTILDPDQVATTLGTDDTPERALAAASLAETIREQYLIDRRSFAFETVLSDPAGAKLGFFRRAQQKGYFVEVHFIGIASAELSQGRVLGRVAAGGHNVPPTKIRARFRRTLANLASLLDLPDVLFIYDNSSRMDPYRLHAELRLGRLVALRQPVPVWLEPLGLSGRATPDTALL